MPSYPPVPSERGTTFTKSLYHDTYSFISPKKSGQAGRYVLITGASKGIGLATALSFAKAGAAGIALCARSDFSNLETQISSAAKAASRTPPQILKIRLDITKYEDVEAAVTEVKRQWGKLDILVNNAGYLSEFIPIVEGDKDEHWRNYEINLRGVYWMCKLFIPLLVNSTQKTILNITSAGAHGLTPGGSGYQVSKLALLRFTEYIMVDHGDEGILAYCVHPGSVRTEVALNMPESLHVILTDQPELAADSLVWLTRERREWLAGRYVSCNWDMEEFVGRKEEIVKGDKLKIKLVV